MVFFRLPTDLQIAIVETWLVGSRHEMLRTLSTLICASNHTLTDEVRLLTSHRSHHWTDDEKGPRDIKHGMRRLHGFLYWLQCWQVPIVEMDESPSFASEEPVYLPTVQSLWYTSISLLLSCPYVTSVGFDTDPWETLRFFPRLPLISLNATCMADGISSMTMRPLIKTFGHCLQSLSIDAEDGHGKAVWEAIVSHCTCLRTLHVNFRDSGENVSACDVIALMKACKNLTDLSLDGFHGVLTDLSCVLANKQLKRLYLESGSDDHDDYDDDSYDDEDFSNDRRLGRIGENTFGDIVAAYPWLDHITIYTCSYGRTGELTLRLGSVDMEGLVPILTHCKPLYKLYLCVSTDTADLLTVLCENINELTELDLHNHHSVTASAPLWSIPLHCPQLTKLTVDDCCIAILSDRSLKRLAKSCPCLQHLQLGSQFVYQRSSTSSTYTYKGLLALFKRCRDLTVLVCYAPFVFTFHTLKLIVKHRVQLVSITGCFSEVDERKFRRLARKYQLLPVPKLIRSLR